MIANKLLEKGLDIEFVADATGLAREEVKKILN